MSIAVGILGLVGGAGVIGEAVLGRSAWLMFAAVGGPSLAVALIGWQVVAIERRLAIGCRVRIGVAAGVFGLVAYDAARWFVVGLLGSDLNPFEAFPVFGELLIGSGHSHSSLFAAGFGYHVFNGIGFAVFFAVLMETRGVVAGIAWAFVLEIATLAIYPGWLNIGAVREFTIMSVTGHVAYGAMIGGYAKHRLDRP